MSMNTDSAQIMTLETALFGREPWMSCSWPLRHGQAFGIYLGECWHMSVFMWTNYVSVHGFIYCYMVSMNTDLLGHRISVHGTGRHNILT